MRPTAMDVLPTPLLTPAITSTFVMSASSVTVEGPSTVKNYRLGRGMSRPTTNQRPVVYQHDYNAT